MASRTARVKQFITRKACAMLTLLIDPDELLDTLQPQTRQSRREEIREKRIKDNRLRKTRRVSLDHPAPATSKKERAKAAYRHEARSARAKKIGFSDHCLHVAGMIVRIASDLERLADEERQWFADGNPGLVDSLARVHHVVDKYRLAGSPTAVYERQVIEAALELCKLDMLIEIQESVGYVRLNVLKEATYWRKGFSRLRAA